MRMLDVIQVDDLPGLLRYTEPAGSRILVSRSRHLAEH